MGVALKVLHGKELGILEISCRLGFQGLTSLFASGKTLILAWGFLNTLSNTQNSQGLRVCFRSLQRQLSLCRAREEEDDLTS